MHMKFSDYVVVLNDNDNVFIEILAGINKTIVINMK